MLGRPGHTYCRRGDRCEEPSRYVHLTAVEIVLGSGGPLWTGRVRDALRNQQLAAVGEVYSLGEDEELSLRDDVGYALGTL